MRCADTENNGETQVKIVILTIGTFGDVQPYVALGLGLQQDGFEVVFATHNCFAPFVYKHGLKFVPLAGDPQQWSSGSELQMLTEAGRDFHEWMKTLRQLADPLIESILQSCWQACQCADAIIYSPFAWAGYSIAEKLGIPSIGASLQPMTSTSKFPAVWAPRGIRLGKIYNRATHLLVEQTYWFFWKRYINRWRTDFLSLNPLPPSGPYSQRRWKNQLHLYGFSPSLLAKPPDWPENTYITGYWFLPEDPKWQPHKELVDFLSCGPPPVYIGFGSMPDSNLAQLGQIVAEGLKNTGLRAVVQGKWVEEYAGGLPDTMLRIDWVPHDWLFPRMAAVVHHGGASTVANAWRAGVPSVVVPFSWDQPFWGEILFRSGTGCKPVPRRNLTSNNLGNAVNACLHGESLRHNAERLGTRIRSENGVDEAVKTIQRYLKISV